jgi:hypothetical protein
MIGLFPNSFLNCYLGNLRLMEIISSDDSKLESSVVTENCHFILIIAEYAVVFFF